MAEKALHNASRCAWNASNLDLNLKCKNNSNSLHRPLGIRLPVGFFGMGSWDEPKKHVSSDALTMHRVDARLVHATHDQV